MKKILLSLTVILTFFAYAIQKRTENAIGPNIVSVNTLIPASSSVPNSSGNSVVTPLANTPVATLVGSKYKDGQFIGIVTDAYYGNVQVKVIISGGKITDIQFLDYPHDRRTSENINSQAMPYLKAEAMQVQNANVDIVSGATATSMAFQKSLQSALSKAI